MSADDRAQAQPPREALETLAAFRTSVLKAEIRRREDVDRAPDRGTPERPCEECLQTDKGSTVDGRGFMRCNSCGYPSQ